MRADAIHVVHGHGGEQVKQALASEPVNWVLQAEQLGTGHAVAQAIPAIPDDHQVLILFGDVPLVRASTLQQLIAHAGAQGLGVLTVVLADPTGYGRIVRDNAGNVVRIVEAEGCEHQGARDPRDQHRADDRAGALAAHVARGTEERQRAGRVLSDRRRS